MLSLLPRLEDIEGREGERPDTEVGLEETIRKEHPGGRDRMPNGCFTRALG